MFIPVQGNVHTCSYRSYCDKYLSLHWARGGRGNPCSFPISYPSRKFFRIIFHICSGDVHTVQTVQGNVHTCSNCSRECSYLFKPVQTVQRMFIPIQTVQTVQGVFIIFRFCKQSCQITLKSVENDLGG